MLVTGLVEYFPTTPRLSLSAERRAGNGGPKIAGKVGFRGRNSAKRERISSSFGERMEVRGVQWRAKFERDRATASQFFMAKTDFAIFLRVKRGGNLEKLNASGVLALSKTSLKNALKMVSSI